MYGRGGWQDPRSRIIPHADHAESENWLGNMKPTDHFSNATSRFSITTYNTTDFFLVKLIYQVLVLNAILIITHFEKFFFARALSPVFPPHKQKSHVK